MGALRRSELESVTNVTQGSFVRRHIRPCFDEMILDDIKATDIVAFHKTIAHLSTKTRRTIHTILGTMFSIAVELDIICQVASEETRPSSEAGEDGETRPQ